MKPSWMLSSLAQGGPGSRPRHRHRGGGAGNGPRRRPQHAIGPSECAAKPKMARRFVTLGPPRGCPSVPGGRRGGGGRPRGVQGSAPATVTEGAGPATGRGGAPKTRLGRLNLRLSPKMARRFVTLGPPRGCPTVRGGRRGGGSPPKGTTTLMRLLTPLLPS